MTNPVTSSADELMVALGAAQAALWQYRDDLRYPPTGDSLERRKEMASSASAMVDDAIASLLEATNPVTLSADEMQRLADEDDLHDARLDAGEAESPTQ